MPWPLLLGLGARALPWVAPWAIGEVLSRSGPQAVEPGRSVSPGYLAQGFNSRTWGRYSDIPSLAWDRDDVPEGRRRVARRVSPGAHWAARPKANGHSGIRKPRSYRVSRGRYR